MGVFDLLSAEVVVAGAGQVQQGAQAPGTRGRLSLPILGLLPPYLACNTEQDFAEDSWRSGHGCVSREMDYPFQKESPLLPPSFLSAKYLVIVLLPNVNSKMVKWMSGEISAVLATSKCFDGGGETRYSE